VNPYPIRPHPPGDRQAAPKPPPAWGGAVLGYASAMTLTLELPPETEARLRRAADREGQTLAAWVRTLAEAEAGRQRALDDDACARCQRQELTQGEAASLLGLTRAAFLRELGARGLSPFQYNAAPVLAEAGLA